jgi:hypothetical protein
MRFPNPIRWIREWGEADASTVHHTVYTPCVWQHCRNMGELYHTGGDTYIHLCPRHVKAWKSYLKKVSKTDA